MPNRNLDDAVETAKEVGRSFSKPKLVGFAALIIVLLVGWFQLFVHLDAGKILVVQQAFTGKLIVHTDPGTHLLLGGTPTQYDKRAFYSFSAAKDQGSPKDESLKVRFNDGGHAQVSGVMSWEMPTDDLSIIKLHTLYRSQTAIEQQLVRTTTERAMYLTSPLMSSTESYAARRSEFLQLFDDQVRNGVYQTHTISKKEPDPITGTEKTVTVVEITKDAATGGYKREGDSPFKEFGIHTLPPTINDIHYDDDVETMIKQQRDAVMKVQTSKAQALEAEQRTLTVAKNGEANAAEAKWAQEKLKATAVTLAMQEKEVAETTAAKEKSVAVTKGEQERQVADLAKQAAEFTKQQNILLGEGEAARKKLVLAADGALEQKLRTYQAVMTEYAHSIAAYKGNWVPGVVMGGSNAGATTSGAQAMIDFLTVKAARDLSLDMSIPSGATPSVAPAK